MTGALLNTINVRLDHNSIAFILTHAESRVLIFHSSFYDTVKQAVQLLKIKPILISIGNPHQENSAEGSIYIYRCHFH